VVVEAIHRIHDVIVVVVVGDVNEIGVVADHVAEHDHAADVADHGSAAVASSLASVRGRACGSTRHTPS
jgi:hypothetical protein